MRHGGDDEDEVDYRSRKRAKRTSGSGGTWRAYVREATHGQKGIHDLKVVGQLYNKLSTEVTARLQVSGVRLLWNDWLTRVIHTRWRFGSTESNITREPDRR